jgi:hypothetical protein
MGHSLQGEYRSPLAARQTGGGLGGARGRLWAAAIFLGEVMAGRFSNSWDLVKASWTLLMQDKELLVFPLFSSISAILLVVSFALPLWVTGVFEHLEAGQGTHAGSMMLGFFFYFCLYAVGFFFNTALVGAALMRLEGQQPSVADGLRIARSKFVAILGYAAIAATVGVALKFIENRVGVLGNWIARLFGIAFSVATFLTVPILATSDMGPVDAVKQSATLLKKTWGENIIVNAGMGWAFAWIYAAILIMGLMASIQAIVAGHGAFAVLFAGTAVLGFVLAVMIHAALQGVYAAVLYRYASTGQSGSDFDQALLAQAFSPRG